MQRGGRNFNRRWRRKLSYVLRPIFIVVRLDSSILRTLLATPFISYTMEGGIIDRSTATRPEATDCATEATAKEKTATAIVKSKSEETIATYGIWPPES